MVRRKVAQPFRAAIAGLKPCATLLMLCLPAGCSPTVDVAAALRLESVTTGWADASPLGANNRANNGTNNRLVPVVSFTVKNASDHTLAPVHVNAVFRRVGEAAEWSNGMIIAAGSSGLAPAAAAGPLVIKGGAGYTGTDPHWDLLSNSEFVDATVDLFARYGSRQWTPVGEFRIARQIIER
jgi:hypothetical protein